MSDEFTACFSAGRVPDQRLSRTEKGIPSYTLEKSMICDAALCVLEISLSAVSGLQKWMHGRVRRKLWDMCKLRKTFTRYIVVLVFLCLQCSQGDVQLSVKVFPLVI